MVAAAIVEDPVSEEEAEAPGGQPGCHCDGATSFEGLRGELEGQRADQNSGAEGHDEPDRALAGSRLQADDGSEQQGRPADKAPEARLQHRAQLPVTSRRHAKWQQPVTGLETVQRGHPERSSRGADRPWLMRASAA